MPRDLVRSVDGARWRRPLAGQWAPWVRHGPPGELWWGGGDAESGSEQFDTWEALERRYHEVFGRLHALGVVRAAWPRRGEDIVHAWPAPGGR